jgi:hypothetical protein
MESEMRALIDKNAELSNTLRYYQFNIQRISTQVEQEIAKPGYLRANDPSQSMFIKSKPMHRSVSSNLANVY